MSESRRRRTDDVTLVDVCGHPIGRMGKLPAHRTGALHSAFSIFIFNDRRELLLQRRAPTKYHSAGLWSNTCCGHPRPGEAPTDAASRRLNEEMGFRCQLSPTGSILYRLNLADGLIEHEYDHTFVGLWSGDPRPDPSEVGAWMWCPVSRLHGILRSRSHRLTAWFPLAWRQVRQGAAMLFA